VQGLSGPPHFGQLGSFKHSLHLQSGSWSSSHLHQTRSSLHFEQTHMHSWRDWPHLEQDQGSCSCFELYARDAARSMHKPPQMHSQPGLHSGPPLPRFHAQPAEAAPAEAAPAEAAPAEAAPAEATPKMQLQLVQGLSGPPHFGQLSSSSGPPSTRVCAQALDVGTSWSGTRSVAPAEVAAEGAAE